VGCFGVRSKLGAEPVCVSPTLSVCVAMQISGDPRFDAVSERQRRTIFRRFVDSIDDPESADASLLSVAPLGELNTYMSNLGCPTHTI